MNTILNRKSIRKYKNIKATDDIVKDLLKAGMVTPLARVSK
ncbi:nitroreductase [Clostridium botulinum]|nr:nitroreductase [Clostridium botulinum]